MLHILHDHTLSEENKQKLIDFVHSYEQEIKFYPVTIDVDAFKYFAKKISPAHFYRLATPDKLSEEIEKIIYLDADIIVNLDIKDLWNEDIKDSHIGAVVDKGQLYLCDNVPLNPLFNTPGLDPKRYFNSGVLLMNLKKLRKEYPNFLNDGMNLRLQHPEWYLNDNDALMYMFRRTFYELPYKYNKSVHYEMVNNFPISEGIYHYVGATLGFRYNYYNNLYWHYFSKTPWFDDKFLMKSFNLTYSALSDWINANLKFTLTLANSMHRKFIVANEEIKQAMQKFFPEGQNNVYEIIKDGNINLQTNKGEIIVFVLFGYDNLKKMLIEKGLREYINFVNGFPLYELVNGRLTVNEFQMIKGL